MEKFGPPIDSVLEYPEQGFVIRDSLAWAEKRAFSSQAAVAEDRRFIRIDSPAPVEVLVEWEQHSGATGSPGATTPTPGVRAKSSTAGADDLPVSAPVGPSTEGQGDDHAGDPFSVPVLVDTGRRLAGLEFISTGIPTDEKPAATDNAVRQHDLDLVKGVLWHACVVTIDDLFEDLMSFPDDLSPQEDAQKNTLILSELPPGFAEEINGFSARKFLAAVIDVTNHLTHQWHPLPTIAHALALRVLLNKTEQLAEIFTVDLTPGWRTVLEEHLYGGLDLEPLYTPDVDAHADRHHRNNGLRLDFASWFTPFDPRQRLNPFTAT